MTPEVESRAITHSEILPAVVAQMEVKLRLLRHALPVVDQEDGHGARLRRQQGRRNDYGSFKRGRYCAAFNLAVHASSPF
jgi:hypothetical protein